MDERLEGLVETRLTWEFGVGIGLRRKQYSQKAIGMGSGEG